MGYGGDSTKSLGYTEYFLPLWKPSVREWRNWQTR
jgi:hypothetical protein